MPCDQRCMAKALLNGGNIAGISDANWHLLKRMKPEDFNTLDGDELIKLLNRMEDDAVKVQKLLVKGVGYDGPTGKMLEG